MCESLTWIARRLCSSYVDSISVEALIASKLITLSKDPCARPIGVCKVHRRLIGESILSVMTPDIIEVAGCQQFCAGKKSPCEAIVHCVREHYDSGDAERVLCVDATNAFNALNRELHVALRNILHLCPSFGRLLINTYRFDVPLFIDHDCIFLVRARLKETL